MELINLAGIALLALLIRKLVWCLRWLWCYYHGQIPQQISIGAAQGEDVLPVPGDGPRGGGEEGAEHPHEGGFAGAVDAQQAVDTGVHGVGQVVYGGKG